MESRSFYEADKELQRIIEDSRQTQSARIPGAVVAGYSGSRKERRAQAAIDRREAKKKRTVTA